MKFCALKDFFKKRKSSFELQAIISEISAENGLQQLLFSGQRKLIDLVHDITHQLGIWARIFSVTSDRSLHLSGLRGNKKRSALTCISEKIIKSLQKSPFYLAALISSVLASSSPAVFPPPCSQVHNQPLQAYILLTLQPQRKERLSQEVLEKLLTRVPTGPAWVVCSSQDKSWGQEVSTLIGWVWVLGPPTESRGKVGPSETHELRVRTGWHSQKRREWMLSRQKL